VVQYLEAIEDTKARYSFSTAVILATGISGFPINMFPFTKLPFLDNSLFEEELTYIRRSFAHTL